MKQSRTVALGTLLMLGAAGCAARSSVHNLQPVNTDVGDYNALRVAVESHVPEDVMKQVVSLQGHIVSDLTHRNLFEEVRLDDGSDPEEGTLLLKVVLQEARKVGGAKRALLGAFAGRAGLTADVQFIDASSGDVLGKYAIKGESGGLGWSGGTEDAVEKTGAAICDLVMQLRTGAGVAVGSRTEQLYVDNVQEDWLQASAADDIEAYQNFISRHPSSQFTPAARSRLERLSLERDWAIAQAADGVADYEKFLRDHPSGEFADRAQARLAVLHSHLRAWQDVQQEGTLSAYQRYVSQNGESPYVDEAKRVIAEMRGRDIVDLLNDESIEAEVEGYGIERVRLRLRRRTRHKVTVRIPVGTFFVSRNSRVQNMVATAGITRELRTDEWIRVTLPAACANRSKDIPGRGDSFEVRRSPQQDELTRLIPVLDRARVGYPVRQAAVWIVTDNASYGALGILVRGLFRTDLGPRVIREKAAAHAMKLCDEAGIDITGKRIWRDREKILEGLDEGELKNWLERRSR